jgi:tRNA dimethylallyltransferase
MPYIHWYRADEIPEENLLPMVFADVAGFFSQGSN